MCMYMCMNKKSYSLAPEVPLTCLYDIPNLSPPGMGIEKY